MELNQMGSAKHAHALFVCLIIRSKHLVVDNSVFALPLSQHTFQYMHYTLQLAVPDIINILQKSLMQLLCSGSNL